MDYRNVAGTGPELAGFSADVLLVVLTPEAPRTGCQPLDALVSEALAAGDLELKDGQTLYVHRPAGLKALRLAVAVAGGDTPRQFKSAVARLAGHAKGARLAHAGVAVAQGLAVTAAHAEALAAALADATYVYSLSKPSAPKPAGLKKVSLITSAADAPGAREGLARGQALAAGSTLARELGNRPGNYCTPTSLANEARQLGKAYKHLKVEVLDRAAIEKIGMGSFLSVAKGSAEPPRFIVLRYEGAGKDQAPVVLVGKGITFDTGGISIKPAGDMDEMKFDMGGAASVLGTFRAVAELRPKVNLIGLVPTCENMPSGTATKPGDVVTSLSGQTIEVLNTDAEGRLILCDALTYAERFKPAVVVDIATLTGACVIALGHIHSGLFSADDELADALEQAGKASGDTAWRMPLDDEYGESLKSNFADMGNVGGRAGGAITAAVFLGKFTKAYRWAHLDIAGTAWKSGGAKGGTGRPVPLLTHFVLSQQGKGALAPKAVTKAANKPAARKTVARRAAKA
ncbi:leucyl aminopeptidase [Aquabacterium soli]|uniref:Probable cytosol aminopeptidase n=1 Tax=Aquabacterium soli TaxID=2493092 RepID=A0A426VAY2_9BURK|nr:leucyl aminopeptidase [Aquabacterium soli]RRS04056.1 leucyl aminopeptidase [Aquabacterium soli]